MSRALCIVAVALAAAGLVAPDGAEAQSRPHVVMVALDEFPTQSILARNGRIDHARYPGFAALAGDSTWFSNATTQSDSTKYALPAILDGRVPRRGVPATFRGHPRSIFTLLRRRGYRIQSGEEATTVCPYSSCRRRHTARYFLVRERRDRVISFIRSIRAGGPPTLYFKHTLLPHVPWTLLPSGKSYLRTVVGPIKGLNSDLSVHDPFLVRQSWQRHLLQVGAVDRMIQLLIARLKQTGLYDRTLLVVVADHGVAFRVGAPDKRTVTHRNIGDIAPVPFFVKAPGQRRARINRAWVRTSDVFPTMADVLNVRIPWRHGGRSGFSRAVRGRRVLRVLSRSPKPVLTIGTGRLASLKRSSLRRRLAWLGSGRRSLFTVGPHQGLIGRYVARIRVLNGGGLRARLANGGEYRNVQARSTFLPVQVLGRIRGGRRRTRRHLAVAVNGRIWGTGRSFYLRGRRTETFSIFIPDSVLSPGNNNIEVLAVRSVKRRLRFRRIYGRPVGP